MQQVSKYVEEFLDYLQSSGRKPRTVEAYKGRLLELCIEVGSKQLDQVKPTDLVKLLVPDEGANKRRSINTLAMRTQAIKTFFQYAANRGYIAVSPARDLQRASRAKSQAEPTSDMYLVSKPAGMPARLDLEADNLFSQVEEYLAYKAAMGRAAATLKLCRERLAPFLNYFVGYELATIKPRMLDLYVASLRERFSPANIGAHVSALKTFMNFCVTRGYVAASPAQHLLKPKVTHINPDKVIGQMDLERMIEYTKVNQMTLDYCLLLFFADSGCRLGELVNLNIRNLDLVRMEALVNGKTGLRPVDFTNTTVESIKAWLLERPRTDPDALFTTRMGRITTSAVYHRLQRIALELGIKRFNPHSIRHRVGQAWVDRGVNLELVRIKLGHVDVTTTAKFYTHQDRDRAKRASRQFSIVGGMA